MKSIIRSTFYLSNTALFCAVVSKTTILHMFRTFSFRHAFFALVAREQAMKAPVKMIFPMMLFIFPAIFIVMLGTLIIYLIQTVLYKRNDKTGIRKGVPNTCFLYIYIGEIGFTYLRMKTSCPYYSRS